MSKTALYFIFNPDIFRIYTRKNTLLSAQASTKTTLMQLA